MGDVINLGTRRRTGPSHRVVDPSGAATEASERPLHDALDRARREYERLVASDTNAEPFDTWVARISLHRVTLEALMAANRHGDTAAFAAIDELHKRIDVVADDVATIGAGAQR